MTFLNLTKTISTRMKMTPMVSGTKQTYSHQHTCRSPTHMQVTCTHTQTIGTHTQAISTHTTDMAALACVVVALMADEDNWRNDYPDEEGDSDASSECLEGSDDEDICRYHSHRRYQPREAIIGKLVLYSQPPSVMCVYT